MLIRLHPMKNGSTQNIYDETNEKSSYIIAKMNMNIYAHIACTVSV